MDLLKEALTTPFYLLYCKLSYQVKYRGTNVTLCELGGRNGFYIKQDGDIFSPNPRVEVQLLFGVPRLVVLMQEKCYIQKQKGRNQLGLPPQETFQIHGKKMNVLVGYVSSQIEAGVETGCSLKLGWVLLLLGSVYIDLNHRIIASS